MTLYTFGGNASAVLTTTTGDVVPDYPVLVRAAGTGALITALFEEDGTTPIAQLRSNPASSDQPGAIRAFKADGYPAIEYEYNGPSGDPVRLYEASREALTSALEGLNSKLDKTGGTITGNLDVTGTVDVQELLVGGQPFEAGADWSEAGIILPATADGAGIQAALTEAKDAGGGWVIVPPGTYDVSSLPLRIYRNTRLTLATGATIRRAGTGTMLLNGDASQTLGGYTGHGNIIIEGGVWDCRAPAYPTSAMCISIGHAEDVTVRDTVIKDVCGFHGIELNAVKRGRISRVTALGYLDPDGTRTFSEAFQIDLAKGSSYFGGFGPYDDTPCTDILVEGCSVGPSGTSGTTSWPRAFGSHSASPGKPHTDIRVRDLRCEDLSQFAIGGYTWQDVIVSGVQLRNCGGGVRMRTLDSSSASHRTPAGGSTPTITGSQPLHNIVIDDITMEGGGSYDAAVRVEGEDTGYVGQVVISNVTTRDIGAQAVRLVDVEDYTLDNVNAYNCGATAVSTLGTRRGRITAHVNGTAGAGITVDSRSTSASTATDVAVRGCSVTGAAANGIHIWDGTDVVVDGCDVYGVTGFGIQVSTNTARPVIRGNRVRNTTSAGINITSTCTAVRRYGNTPGSVTDASTNPNTSPYDSGAGLLPPAIKSGDTPRTSTVTTAADPHLSVPVEAGATYDVECVAVWTTGGGGLRATWSAPAGSSMTWTDNDGVGVASPTGVVTFSGTTGTTFKGTLVVGSTAGTLALAWAQNTSNASATTLKAGSRLELTRIA